MTDRMLSAAKVAIVLDGLDIAVDGHTSKKFREGGARVIKHIRAELDSGELDADRPECDKCGDTGKQVGLWEPDDPNDGPALTTFVPCDCKASK